jgi:hypothetical protein
MPKTFDYAKRADECQLRAATAANDQAREVWREMEAYWRKRIEATTLANAGKPNNDGASLARSEDRFSLARVGMANNDISSLPQNDDRVTLAPPKWETDLAKLKI